jgi:hypothetical protein
MNNKIKGSIDVLNSLQIMEDVEGMDTASTEFLKNKEVLAIILKGAAEEYAYYSLAEIMDFIETDSIAADVDVTTGRTNTRIRGENVEFKQLNEKTSNFDMRFRAKNPLLSNDVLVNLHVDIESQMDYKPGYPIEKRGLYYLSRELSSQLSVITNRTNYNQLEKCYSIWICRDNIPKEERYSISKYTIQHRTEQGECHPKKEDYDLLELVIIRLGHENCPTSDDLFEFLNAVLYPRKKDFIDTVQKYIDFSDNEELQEVTQMHGLGMSILMDGYREGCEDGRLQGHSEGREKLLIELVCKKLRRQKTVETIADELEEDEERIRRICEVAENYAPEYDSQQIYDELKMS